MSVFKEWGKEGKGKAWKENVLFSNIHLHLADSVPDSEAVSFRSFS